MEHTQEYIESAEFSSESDKRTKNFVHKEQRMWSRTKRQRRQRNKSLRQARFDKHQKQQQQEQDQQLQYEGIQGIIFGYLDITEFPIRFINTTCSKQVLCLWLKNSSVETTTLKYPMMNNPNQVLTTHKINGKLHRFDGPAFYCDSEQKWFQNNQLHRDGDEPALMSEHLTEWRKSGQLHRDHDKPARIETYLSRRHERGMDVERKNIIESWWKHGRLHRSGGLPAMVSSEGATITTQCWYEHGRLHRLDGPAVIEPLLSRDSSSSVKERWFREGIEYYEPAGFDALLCGDSSKCLWVTRALPPTTSLL